MKHQNYLKHMGLLTVALLLLLAMPQTHWADSNASQKTGKSISPALATSVPAAMKGLNDKSIYLIDVRLPGVYEQYRIPGSLNIALHEIKTKSFLKSKPVVLVNEGFALTQMAATCDTLNQSGYKATILSGGLLAWKAKGGRLLGDPFAMQQLNQVSSQVLMQEAGCGHHLLVDASEKKDNYISPFEGAIHLDLLNNPKGSQQLKKMIQKNSSDPFYTPLICTVDGQTNDRIQRVLAQAGIHTVFFLHGGGKAYQQQQEYKQRAAKPKQERTISTDGCQTCPQ